MSDLTVTMTIIDGQPFTTSLDVAEKFEKKHQHVLEAIRKLLEDLGEGKFPQSEDFGRSNFRQSSYINAQGKEQPCYHLTRDAFSLLAMGFTGKAALAWKVKYIEAFNAMEAELLKQAAGKARGCASRGRPAKALPAPEPRLNERGMEAMKRILRLRAELFEASLSINDIMSFNTHNPAMSEERKAFAGPLNAAVGAFFMAINHNLIAIENMFKAFCEAEKYIIHS